MPDQFSAFVRAIPSASTNPLALVAYLATVIAWAVIAFRVKRNSALLKKLNVLPKSDRLEALRLEMGGTNIPGDVTPEMYIAHRHAALLLYAFLALCATATIISAIALFDSGKISGVIGLWS